MSGTKTTWGSLTPNPDQAEIAVYSGIGAGIECRNHYIHVMVVCNSLITFYSILYCDLVGVCFCVQSTQETVENLNHAKAELEKLVAK